MGPQWRIHCRVIEAQQEFHVWGRDQLSDKSPKKTSFSCQLENCKFSEVWGIYHGFLANCAKDRIIQCAQCTRAHEASPHWRPHHQAVAKIVILKVVIEVWLKCIEITTTKKAISFYGEKNCEGPTKAVHTLPRQLNPAMTHRIFPGLLCEKLS